MAEAKALTSLRKNVVSRSRIVNLETLVKDATTNDSYVLARHALGHALHFERELGTDTIVPKLKTELGADGFNALMSVYGDVSLVFVVDTTGSMAAEIQAAKRIIKAIASYPRKSAVNYVLSPFNNPSKGWAI